MKKLALAVATSALGAYATAATVTEFANGVLVPRAIHGGSGADSTAVGLTSCAAGTVYWTFFDVNTKHITDGSFGMTAEDQASFIWADEAGFGLENTEGYLVFVLDTGGLPNTLDSSDVPCLAGNAFQIDSGSADVAYLPTLPLQTTNPGFDIDDAPLSGDFGEATDSGIFNFDLTDLTETSIPALAAGANGGDTLYLRYFIEGDADTSILIWSADDVSGSYTVNMYNTDQERKSVTLNLPNAELNNVNPKEILGRPEGFVDGFIRWTIPSEFRGVFSWSVIDAPAFGAVQTVVNPIKLMTNGVDEVRVRVPADLVRGD